MRQTEVVSFLPSWWENMRRRLAPPRLQAVLPLASCGWRAGAWLADGTAVLIAAEAAAGHAALDLIKVVWRAAIQEHSLDPFALAQAANVAMRATSKKEPLQAKLGVAIIFRDVVQYFCAGHSRLIVVSETGGAPAVTWSRRGGEPLGDLGEVELSTSTCVLRGAGTHTILLGAGAPGLEPLPQAAFLRLFRQVKRTRLHEAAALDVGGDLVCYRRGPGGQHRAVRSGGVRAGSRVLELLALEEDVETTGYFNNTK